MKLFENFFDGNVNKNKRPVNTAKLARDRLLWLNDSDPFHNLKLEIRDRVSKRLPWRDVEVAVSYWKGARLKISYKN